MDASFWINLVRCGVANFLLDYFYLIVTPAVLRELTALMSMSEPPERSRFFTEWQQQGFISIEAPGQVASRFDIGENEAMALAQEHGWPLLMDNAAPRNWGRGRLGLRVIDSPAFIVFLYDQRRLDLPDALVALSLCQAARQVVREGFTLLGSLAQERGER